MRELADGQTTLLTPQNRLMRAITVITHSTHWRKTCQKYWSQCLSHLFVDGSTECTAGWKLIGLDLAHQLPSCKSRGLALWSINCTDEFPRPLQGHLIDVRYPLYIPANLDFPWTNFSLSFDSKKKSSRVSLQMVKRCIFMRGRNIRIYFGFVKSLHKTGGD
jgi:hypothetical protein